ncbi:MAG: acyl-ACP--UDP-N-acetylglucosamine O-acyltransferase [Lentisphaerae bacterium]|nr:acyl-ACP--UDP-N-acetylglucosamine O-acyltransferase [Lentisphaerota bacterium]
MIHPTAIVNPGAEIGEDVEIGAYSVIGPKVRIGRGTQIMPHAVIDGATTIGADCRIFPFACIGTQTQDLKFTGGETFVQIGDRTTIREYVTVNCGTNEGETTRVGSDCLLMISSHVAHASIIGNGVILGNATGLAGEVTIEDFAIVSGLTGVHQFTKIGRYAFIGGCSKISQDCPPFMIAEGNPAVVRGINSVGIKRHGMSEESQRQLKQAYKIIYREGFSVRNAIEKIRSDPDMSSEEISCLISFVESSKRGIIR